MKDEADPYLHPHEGVHVMLTVASITDAQIKDLLEDDDDEIVDAARVALGDRPRGSFYPRSTVNAIIQTNAARAMCAEILNARVPCRACDGDGILAADGHTPPNERVTGDSRRCNYCGGKGYQRKDSRAR